ncbi:hypothetical protein AMJ44_09395 [candidate division WOR-1 bacterium DG_54_3]|uniref:Uncharacterized protein n=1 Tax=candidate division WOR-1 bacterium DG_54_3 TaxID=1703775 RepID=A0A0S7XUB5_UNCSA|nr:MAG: hypothetical protein AMJ44_09395 [candidate division WOR-1 bacterium DG_54_3]
MSIVFLKILERIKRSEDGRASLVNFFRRFRPQNRKLGDLLKWSRKPSGQKTVDLAREVERD